MSIGARSSGDNFCGFVGSTPISTTPRTYRTVEREIEMFYVCIDCADVIANCWSNFNDRYPSNYSETNARREDIEKGLEKGEWVLGDEELTFSSKLCDCCGSTFAGSRISAYLI